MRLEGVLGVGTEMWLNMKESHDCQPASRIDQRPASNVDHANRRQAHGSHREMSLEPWSVFDACEAKVLVKLQRPFTLRLFRAEADRTWAAATAAA